MTTIAHQPILVLNKMWTPVGVVGIRRAMGLLTGEYSDGEPKAKIIQKQPDSSFAVHTWSEWAELKPAEDDPNVIRTYVRAFLRPSIIGLTRCDTIPQIQRVRFNRRTLFRRDGYRCQYCGKKPGTEELTLDHVNPRCLGGQTTWENIVCSCIDCNRKKAGKTLAQIGWKLKTVPVKPKIDILPIRGRKIPASWTDFISEEYWSTELVNDMDE